jgi:ribosomal-protein-alanine N-acetyltransferase
MAQIDLPLSFPFTDPSLPYKVGWMRVDDIDEVMPIERVAFPSPWPASAYRYELTQNDLSSYLVLRQRHPRAGDLRSSLLGLMGRTRRARILGYGGFWLILDEGHISTIAVHPDWRGRGLGELLLVSLMDAAILRGAGELTLEVRVSNLVAQNMYRKYGFVQVGVRKRYYHDNNEDAWIMTTPRIDEAAFERQYARLKERLRERLHTSGTDER